MILSFETYLQKVDEGLIKTYNIDFVIDKSMQLLSSLNTRFSIIKNPNNTIKLTIYDFKKIYIDELFNLLNSNFTNMFGWYPSYMYMINTAGIENHMNYDERYLKEVHLYLDEVSILYESNFDEEVDIPDLLYHISISEYKNKILSNGIFPKSKSKLSSHGNRIYVCKSIEDCMEIIPKMKFYFFNKNNRINKKWIIYEISTNNLKNIKMYKDPNFINKGYYITNNIPPNNIKVVSEE